MTPEEQQAALATLIADAQARGIYFGIPPATGITPSPASVELGNPAYFTVNFSTGGGDSATSYHWDFGDGTTEDVVGTANVSHTYAEIGAYPITCTATNNFGPIVVPACAVDVTAVSAPALVVNAGSFANGQNPTYNTGNATEATIDYSDGNGVQSLAITDGGTQAVPGITSGRGHWSITTPVTIVATNSAGSATQTFTAGA